MTYKIKFLSLNKIKKAKIENQMILEMKILMIFLMKLKNHYIKKMTKKNIFLIIL